MMRYGFTLILCLVGPSLLLAQEAMHIPWANKFFQPDPPAVLVHDFGTVPHGTMLTKRFALTNIYAVPMQITDVRVSCGCVTADLPKRVLESKETSYIDLKMDGRKFHGPKAVTVWVDFGPKYRSSAVLKLQAFSRGDIMLKPGSIDFGVIPQGQQTSQTLDIEYTGNAPTWQITEILPAKGVDTTVQELARQGNKVTYRLTAALKPDVLAGVYQEQIQLRTNDPSNSLLSVNVAGTIQAPYRLTNPVKFDGVKVGSSQQLRAIIQGTKDFQIERVEGDGDGLFVDFPSSPKKVNLVTVKYQPTKAEQTTRTIKLITRSKEIIPLPVTVQSIP